MTDNIKKAEQRGYQRGYAAGKKAGITSVERENKYVSTQQFREQAFLAALPACIASSGWTRGDKTISRMEEKTRLAWDFADEAIKRRFAA